MPLSAYLQGRVLDHLLRGEVFPQPHLYASLHSSDPGPKGRHELRGGGYGRFPANSAFTGAESKDGTRKTVEEISFEALPRTTVTHLGLWDSRSGGNFLWSFEMKTPVKCSDGATLRLRAGAFSASVE